MPTGDIQPEALQEEKEALESMKSGNLELAQHRLARLCQEYPRNAKFHFNHALVLYKLKHYADALDEVNKGLLLNPEDEKATRFKQEILVFVSKSMLDEGEKAASAEIVDRSTLARDTGKEVQDKGDRGSVIGEPLIETSTILQDTAKIEHVEKETGREPEPRHDTFENLQELDRYKVSIKLAVQEDLATKIERELQEPASNVEEETALKESSMDLESQMKHVVTGEQKGLSEHAMNLLVLQIKEIGKRVEDEATTRDDPPIKEVVIKIKKIALALYESAQYEQSLLIYSTFLDYFTEDLEALFNIGFCEREIGNFYESEKTFKYIIELFYDNAYAWHNLALIYAITNEGDKEVYCLQKAGEFGYAADIQLLSHLSSSFTPKNPFDSD